MKTIKSIKTFVLAGLVFAAGLSGQATAAALNIADRPLFLQAKVPPSFIMGVDDSGSMTFQTLFAGADGQACWNTTTERFLDNSGNPYISGTCDFHYVMMGPRVSGSYFGIPPFDTFGFARSPDYNPSYFNPEVTYAPWIGANMSPYANASLTATRIHPDETGTVNLFATRESDVFRIIKGMRIPTGVQHRAVTSGSWTTGNNSKWNSGSTNRYVRYHPATFYLKYNSDSDAPPAGYVAAQRSKVDVAGCGENGSSCTMWKYELTPANSSVQVRQNFANWFSFYGNRNRAMIAGLTRSLVDVDEMWVGYFRINNRSGNVTMRDMNVASDKTSLYNAILALPASGSTPTLPSVNYIGQQFQRQGNGAPVRLACQINAGMLFTDGYANASQSAPAVTMGVPFDPTPADSMAAIASQYYLSSLRPDFAKQDLVPVSSGCSAPGAANNPKLDCNRFPHMNLHAITLGSVGTIIGNTHGLDENGEVDSDIALDDVIANPPSWPGYNEGSRNTIDDLWHATVNTRGKFINATTPANITDAMTQILNSVAGRAAVSGGTAASGTRREDGFLAYVPHFDSGGWTGNLKAHSLNPDGSLGAVNWDARTRLAAKSMNDRKVYFINATGGVEEFKAGANLPAGTVDALNRAVTDLCPTGQCTRDDVIEYLRGDHSKEERNGGPFRDRMITDLTTGASLPSRMGDILGSQPEVLGKSSYGYASLPTSMGGGSYTAFLNGTKKTRQQLVFVASNNGMLHAFNAQNGEEVWALIPNAVLTDNITAVRTASSAPAHFVGLAYPDYGHRYFFDGSPIQGDAYIGGGWKTVLAAPLGAGGRSMVLLDVTSGGGASAPSVIAEVTHAEMGYAVDRPRIALLKDGTWRAMFGNGYNSNANGARLFSVNLANGAVSSNTVGGPGAGTLADPNGMSSVAASDDDSDLRADVIYAGDYKGNLWKFPVTASGIQNAGNTPLFQARDAAGNVQHITGGIDTITHPRHGQIVYFGTGRYFLDDDRNLLTSPPVESFYGVWDGDGWASAGNTSGATTTYDRSSLVRQTLSAEMAADGKIVRKTSTNALDWGTKKGWYLELATNGTAQGERFVGVPTVALGLVFFTSFLPNADSDACASSGTNWLNVIDATTGVGGLGVGSQTDVGSFKLPDNSSGGGPVGTPPIVVTPPPAGCDPATDPDCQPPLPDDDGIVNPVGAPQCNNDLGILLATGIELISQISCGRQSWRQIQ